MKLRETLLARKQRRYTNVQLDEEVYCLQSLTQAETTHVGLLAVDGQGKAVFSKMDEMRAKTLCLSLVDPDTKERLFDESEWQLLTEIDHESFDHLYDATETLNISSDRQQQEALKNSE